MASSEELITLIESCKDQNPAAQRKLYARFSGQLFATAIRHTNCREDAEDVLQDSFVKIFKHVKNPRAVVNKLILSPFFVEFTLTHNKPEAYEINEARERAKFEAVMKNKITSKQ